jgi:5-methylthioadenosine/S-adenosylhomocysteine deaminase
VIASRLFAARWVLPITAPPIADGAVLVDRDGRIAWLGPRAEAPAAEAIETLGDVILLPGLVDAHTHLELTAMRGLLEQASFFDWIRTLTRARAEVLADDDLLDAARLGVCEGLAAGVTTFADTSASGAPVLQALVELGARGIVYQEVFGPAAEQREASLAGLRRAVAALRARATPLVAVGVSPHAVYSVHEELLVDACAWAAAHDLPVAMHVSESPAEIAFLRDGAGPFADFLRGRGIPVAPRAHSPLHLLAALGVTDVVRPLLIHATQFDASDVALAAHYGCPVAHCPASNAKLGHGVAPLRALLDAGVTVGLGTDGVASNNRLDLLDEARTAALVQRAVCGRADALTAAWGRSRWARTPTCAPSAWSPTPTPARCTPATPCRPSSSPSPGARPRSPWCRGACACARASWSASRRGSPRASPPSPSGCGAGRPASRPSGAGGRVGPWPRPPV